MMKINQVSIGDRVRIKSTRQEVTIEQISQHGFSIIRFHTGGKHRLLNNKLETISGNRLAIH